MTIDANQDLMELTEIQSLYPRWIATACFWLFCYILLILIAFVERYII